MRTGYVDIIIGQVWVLYSSLEPEDKGGGQLFVLKGHREPQCITGTFLLKERECGWYSGEGNKQLPAEGTEAVGGKLKQSDYTLVFCFYKINIYLSHGGY